jgi:Family of unknown function (DUF6256)
VLRAVLPPLITAYVLFAAMVFLAWRRPVARPIARGEGSTRVRLGRVVRTTVGGYVAFLAVVLIFHVWLAKEPDAFVNALWGGAFLSGVALSLACFSSLLGRRSRRHS